MYKLLKVSQLGVEIDDKQVVGGVQLEINPGEIHALMGPNGSGKSSLAKAIVGHPGYKILKDTEIKLEGKEVSKLSPDERARRGMLMAFQSPVAVPGVKTFTFLREAYRELTGEEMGVKEFKDKVSSLLAKMEMGEEFLGRYVNDGFSGGERKKMEVLQILLFRPKLMIIDEVDSGLDVDSLKLVAREISEYVRREKKGALVISHYKRILEYIKPDYVHVMREGKIVQSGGGELVELIEEKGYQHIKDENE